MLKIPVYNFSLAIPVLRLGILPFALVFANEVSAANVVVVDGGTATIVENNVNGRTKITPAPVDRDGISLNTYSRFDIGRPGADFDNTRAGARLIVNEVTSTHPSRLAGDINILGSRANFILANPNGVYVNGVRFQNTGSVALTTAPVKLVDYYPSPDRLQKNILLNTSQGLIEIGEGGLSGAFTHLELIAKDIRINGPVVNSFTHPDSSVRLISGDSSVEIDSGVSPVDEQTPWLYYRGGDQKRNGIAVDITPLGGLVAGRVEILVTDQGAGVRHAGEIYATTGDFVLNSTGAVTLNGGRTRSWGHTLIQSDSIEAHNQSEIVAAGGILHLKTDQNIFLADSEARGGAGVIVDSDALTLSSSRISEAALISGAKVVSDGGDVRLTTRGGVLSEGGEVLAASDILAKVGGDFAVKTGGADMGRFVASRGTLTLDVRGNLSNDGGLLQGYGNADDPSQGAIAIHTGGDLINRTLDPARLGVIFGEAGKVSLISGGDLINQSARIIANGDLHLEAQGSVFNHIEKNAGKNNETAFTQTTREYFLGIPFSRDRITQTDYGQLQIPGQLAYLIADGNLVLTGKNFHSIGGQVHANSGDLRITVTDFIENRAERTGKLEYRRQCKLFCRVSAKSSVVLHGGGLQASNNIYLSAGQRILNHGGMVDALAGIDIETPLFVARAIEGYLAVSQSHGFQSWFGQGYARILRNDSGGTVAAGESLMFSGDVVTEGGVLVSGGDLSIKGSHIHVRDPVHEKLPDDIPKGGLFSSAFY